MNNAVKITLYIVLLSCAMVFGNQFYSRYSAIMEETQEAAEGGDLTQVEGLDSATAKGPRPQQSYSAMMGFGAGFFFSVVGLALLGAHDVSRLVASRTAKLLFNEDAMGTRSEEYEAAEQAWANGSPLEAIQLMRDYLKAHPREQHVALRIAEIYEKDMHNYLAAALEYEEVLKQKLPPEQWGWTAIHLCNLYTSKLNQQEKAVELLRRVDAEYGNTSAADKARKRLSMFDSSGTDGSETISEESSESTG